VYLLLILTASLPASATLPQAVNLFMFNSKTEHTDLNPTETRNKKIQKYIDVGIWGGVSAITVCSGLQISKAIQDKIAAKGNFDLSSIGTLIGINAAMMAANWYTYKKIRT
jgi:hypothetical protein